MKLKRRYRLILLISAVVIVNVFVYTYDYKTPSTKEEVYELDEASLRILDLVDDPIIITFYKSDNLNPLEKRLAGNIEKTLQAYKNATDIPIHIEVVNPYESLEVELEATNSGIKPIEIKESNNALRKIFLGLIIQEGNRTEVLPQIMPRMSTEYLVSSSLRKLTEKGRRRIALIQGHGESELSDMSGIEKRLRPNYDLVPVKMQSKIDLSDYESVVIVGPSFKYSDTELDQLDEFLDEGKSIFIALDRVEYDAEENEGYKINTRIEEWLVRKGVIIQSDFIVDNSCSNVRVEPMAPAIAFPYFPQITNFPRHVSTIGVGVVALRFASSIESIDKKGIQFTPLAVTSEVSGKKSLPLSINMKHEWTKADYLFPRQVVAGLLEGRLGANAENDSKIAVISDADVVLGDENLRELDNHLFVANIIDWLSDYSGLASIKHRGIGEESKEPEVEVSAIKKYLNILLPVAIIGLVALFFFYRRKLHVDKLRTSDF
ncbi:gliding-associated putative ABC transporter substrate-binding component GldG [Balneicella halophila]|uniref:Gliding-associated putative ABC transporter substrate-binding component GldG n=1 Tax=Balneicella halophila TaxID=1537566 RepID=A0A7L4URU4_BALHA|nr:GldG family protein [Balneicella halophila]PVX52496.1 gliding-associated putative ABC transporter substrate-binding component GldG [Balneicella halophila]